MPTSSRHRRHSSTRLMLAGDGSSVLTQQLSPRRWKVRTCLGSGLGLGLGSGSGSGAGAGAGAGAGLGPGS